MQLIDVSLLDNISLQASDSPRLRMNYNLHEHLEDKVQRLLNALEPGTHLPVHRHRHTAETYFLVRGRLRVIFYNDMRKETETADLNTNAGVFGVHIPAGQWHTIEVLETGTVIFEVKEGPYTPLIEDDVM
jgi:cupin fold WbuC family metalloprotein